MPELPEVEHARRKLERYCVGRCLENVEWGAYERGRWEAGDAARGNAGTSAAAIDFSALAGRVVRGAGRWGKHLWLEFDAPPRLFLHLGMTGSIEAERQCEPSLVYQTLKRSSQRGAEPTAGAPWPPAHARLVLTLADGRASKRKRRGAASTCAATQVALQDPRRFATIRLGWQADPHDEEHLQALGFDPLQQMPSVSDFRHRLAPHARLALKRVLLDQSFAAGIGNWLADEILCAARLHPERRVNTLDDTEVAALHDAMQYVVRTACAVHADSSQYPREWLFHVRWSLGRKRRGADGKHAPTARTADGKRVCVLKVAGRTSVYVPAVQRKRGPDAQAGRDEQDVESEKHAAEVKEEGEGEGEVSVDDDDGADADWQHRSASSTSASASPPAPKVSATASAIPTNATVGRKSGTKRRRTLPPEEAAHVFDELRDGSAALTTRHLVRALIRHFGADEVRSLSTESLHWMLRVADRNGDGRIDRDEFQAFLSEHVPD
eukprot:ctg_5067.g519